MATAHGPVTYAELTAGLIWPRLFRALPMALNPARVAVGFLVVAVFMGVGALFDLLTGPIAGKGTPGLFGALVRAGSASASEAVESLVRLNVMPALGALTDFWFGTLPRLASMHPGTFIALVAVLVALYLPVRAVLAGAICRMAVVDVATGRNVSIREALVFAAARWRSLVGSWVIPLALIALVCALLVLAGLVFFRVPVLNVIGAILYGLFLIGGAVAVFLVVGYALGGHLFAPAVVADNADAIDAIQRGYAYVVGRPIRFALYAGLLLLVGAIAYVVLASLTAAALNVTAGLAGIWSDADRLAGGVRTLDFTLQPKSPDVGGSWAAAQSIMGVWERLALALLGGFIIAYHDCASALLYLLLRRVNDEQDIDEIAEPNA